MKLAWLTARTSHSFARRLRRPLELELLEERLVPVGTPLPDFSLPDLHPNTPTSGQNIGRSTFQGAVSGYYFSDAG